jgi:hypothetical protein
VKVPSMEAAVTPSTRGPAESAIPPLKPNAGSRTRPARTLVNVIPANTGTLPDSSPRASAKRPSSSAALPVSDAIRGPGRPTVAPPSQRSWPSGVRV